MKLTYKFIFFSGSLNLPACETLIILLEISFFQIYIVETLIKEILFIIIRKSLLLKNLILKYFLLLIFYFLGRQSFKEVLTSATLHQQKKYEIILFYNII